jgi:phage gp29-like protein
MAQSRIVDANGQPIDLSILQEEVAAGGIMTIRQPWFDSIARGLTPAGLAALLERAARVDAADYLTLAEEMEERDPHYAAVLGVRKRAVAGLPRNVDAASDDPQDVTIAEAVRDLVVAQPAFDELVDDQLDAFGKGYSACEIMWDKGLQWLPTAYPHRDPRHFQWDRSTGRELRLRDQVNPRWHRVAGLQVRSAQAASKNRPADSQRPRAHGRFHLDLQGVRAEGLARLRRGVRHAAAPGALWAHRDA